MNAFKRISMKLSLANPDNALNTNKRVKKANWELSRRFHGSLK
jgi:hypothetical protein